MQSVTWCLPYKGAAGQTGLEAPAEEESALNLLTEHSAGIQTWSCRASVLFWGLRTAGRPNLDGFSA